LPQLKKKKATIKPKLAAATVHEKKKEKPIIENKRHIKTKLKRGAR
jgi:hypothetical protein